MNHATLEKEDESIDDLLRVSSATVLKAMNMFKSNHWFDYWFKQQRPKVRQRS